MYYLELKVWMNNELFYMTQIRYWQHHNLVIESLWVCNCTGTTSSSLQKFWFTGISRLYMIIISTHRIQRLVCMHFAKKLFVSTSYWNWSWVKCHSCVTKKNQSSFALSFSLYDWVSDEEKMSQRFAGFGTILIQETSSLFLSLQRI